MESPLTILLVDDNAQFLQAARDYLMQDSGVNKVRTARSGEEGIFKAELLHPDIVLMDVSMPGMSGFEATRRIKRIEDAPLVVMLTLNNSIDYRCHATAAGADAFLQKDRFATEIYTLLHGLAECMQTQDRASSISRSRKSLSRM